MTAAEIDFPEWVPLTAMRPQYAAYEVNYLGRVRSVNRMDRLGRNVKGGELKPRVSGTSPYPKVTLYDPTGKQTDFTVGALVLLAYVGECPEGQEILHLNDDPLDNRLVNLAYGTHDLNVWQRKQNRPARPKPVKTCVRCGTEFTTSGQRCHPCVVEIGREAAVLLAVKDMDPDKVAQWLKYPSTVGVIRLAKKYGALRMVIEPVVVADEVQAAAAYLERKQPWSRRVTATLRSLRRGGDST